MVCFEHLNKSEHTCSHCSGGHMSGLTNYNPRNLTMFFDGHNVTAAIGHLKDKYSSFSDRTQEWLGCESASLEPGHMAWMIFYEDQCWSWSWSSEKLELEVERDYTPHGPNYDEDCAGMMLPKDVYSAAEKTSGKN
jgi:hypothetical protein